VTPLALRAQKHRVGKCLNLIGFPVNAGGRLLRKEASLNETDSPILPPRFQWKCLPSKGLVDADGSPVGQSHVPSTLPPSRPRRAAQRQRIGLAATERLTIDIPPAGPGLVRLLTGGHG